MKNSIEKNDTPMMIPTLLLGGSFVSERASGLSNPLRYLWTLIIFRRSSRIHWILGRTRYWSNSYLLNQWRTISRIWSLGYPRLQVRPPFQSHANSAPEPRFLVHIICHLNIRISFGYTAEPYDWQAMILKQSSVWPFGFKNNDTDWVHFLKRRSSAEVQFDLLLRSMYHLKTFILPINLRF